MVDDPDSLLLMLPAPLRDALGSTGAARLTAQWNAGRAAWPALELAPTAWAGELAARLTDLPAASGHLDALRPADFYLAAACLHLVPGALEALISTAVGEQMIGLGRTVAGDHLVGEVVARLAAVLATPRGDAPPVLASYDGRAELGDFVRARATMLALEWARAQVATGVAASGKTATATLDAIRAAAADRLAEARDVAARKASATLAELDGKLTTLVEDFEKRMADLRGKFARDDGAPDDPPGDAQPPDPPAKD